MVASAVAETGIDGLLPVRQIFFEHIADRALARVDSGDQIGLAAGGLIDPRPLLQHQRRRIPAGQAEFDGILSVVGPHDHIVVTGQSLPPVRHNYFQHGVSSYKNVGRYLISTPRVMPTVLMNTAT